MGTQYHGGKNGFGRYCGYSYVNMFHLGIPKVNFYCEERDKCLNPAGQTCQKVGVGCNVQYHAYRYGGGRVCGSHYVSGYRTWRYCEPGDYCSSSTAGTCVFRKPECGRGTTYHAYPTGGGSSCGKVKVGSYYYTIKCQPGDTCTASSAGWCRYN